MNALNIPVTLTIAAACAVLNFWLAVRVARLRRGPDLMIGDGGDAQLTAAMRAHANFVEYVPLILILMLGIELVGGNRTALLAVGVVLVLARLSHPFGMGTGRPIAFRAIGIAGTMLVMLGLAGWAAVLAYQGQGTVSAITVETVPAKG